MVRRLILLCLVTYSNSLQSQQKSVIPPAPNAANLAYSTDFPMGLYTGTPNISTPLWTIIAESITLPISLNYTSGGVKVADMASWVGLGWNLNAGGVITRSVVGLPDETPTFGYIDYTVPPLNQQNYSSYLDMANGDIDTEQDLFFFSTPRGSGRFVFDNSGVVQQIPKSNYKITKGPVSTFSFGNFGVADCISSWTVVDEFGNTYRFEDFEKIGTESRNIGLSSGSSSKGINSWYLTEIKSPTNEIITFTYITVDIAYDLPPSKTDNKSLGGSCNYPGSTTVQRQFVNSKRLAAIDFPNGKIRFVAASSGRADLVGDNALDKIIIEDLQGIVLKQFKLEYKYLVGNTLVDYTSIDPSADNNFFLSSSIIPSASFSRRLMLTKVIEMNAAGEALSEGHSFEYHSSIGLPNRASPLMDHWGYANKVDVSGSAQPEVLIVPGSSQYPSVYITEKNPDYQYAKEASLFKIKFPTGGHTEYVYESNEAGPSPFTPPKIIKTPINASLGISHFKYNIDGWYEYPYELVPDDFGNNQRHYYTEFTISDYPLTPAEVILSNVPYYPNSGLQFYIKRMTAPSSTIWSDNHDGTFLVNLSPGTYRLYHSPSSQLLASPNNPDHMSLYSAAITGLYSITIDGGSTGNPPKTGGIRVKVVLTHDPVSQKTLKKVYTYLEDGNSSGELLTAPLYSYKFDVYEGTGECHYVGITYSSSTPLSTTHNSFVGYRFVQEQIVSEQGAPLGKTEYTFISPLQAPDRLFSNTGEASGMAYYDAPNPPTDRRDWLRGFLLTRNDYKYDNPGYSLVKAISHTYKISTSSVSPGFQINFHRLDLTGNPNSFYITQYDHHSGTIYLEKSEESIFSSGLELKTVTTIRNSDKSFLPVFKNIEASDGSVYRELYTYPKEYVGGNAAIDNLVDKNIVGIPIESVKAKESNGQTIITGGSLHQYYATGAGLLESVKLIETTSPIPLTSFKFSNAPNGQLPANDNNTTFEIDNRYKTKFIFNTYNINGKILEQQKANDIKEIFFWGYKGQYPVAKVVGTDYATASTYITQSILDNAVGGADDATLRAELHKLRNIPGTLVTTYTYKPLIGMTSETAPNGRTTYYEYNLFGRLKCIRDHENNILKTFDYKFQANTNE